MIVLPASSIARIGTLPLVARGDPPVDLLVEACRRVGVLECGLRREDFVEGLRILDMVGGEIDEPSCLQAGPQVANHLRGDQPPPCVPFLGL